MEHVGNDPGTIHSTVHNRATAGTSGAGNSVKLPDACDAFHRYQPEWTPQALRFAVDGKLIHSYAKTNALGGWPFDRPQYLLLNLAIGGNMAGKINDLSFPHHFYIDYVRVYQSSPRARR